jgi:integrase
MGAKCLFLSSETAVFIFGHFWHTTPATTPVCGNATMTTEKPEKPYQDFPLFAHRSGQWAKKIRGNTIYFGTWANPEKALKEYMRTKEALYLGMQKPVAGLSVADVVNSFLTAKQQQLDSGELSARSFRDLRASCKKFVAHFGKTTPIEQIPPSAFDEFRTALSKQLGPVAMSNDIRRIRAVLKFAYEASLVDRPIKCGPNFKEATKKSVRKARNKRGERSVTIEEIRSVVCEGHSYLPAATILAINGGMGQSDLAALPLKAIDLEKGWIDFPRPKTEMPRRVPLWPETIELLKKWLKKRKKREGQQDLVFVTEKGCPLVTVQTNGLIVDAIGQAFSKHLRKHELKRPGISFYALRHTFQTISDETKDFPAIRLVMGHVADERDMSAKYRQSISDERLQAVVEAVRQWLKPFEFPCFQAGNVNETQK